MADDKSKVKNAQSAISEYYDDMLGSLTNDPLQKLIKAEQEEKIRSQPGSKSQHPLERQKQQKKKTARALPSTFYDEFYEEQRQKEIVAPLIIPAAFPKMAPDYKAVEPETKTALKEGIKKVFSETTIPQVVQQAAKKLVKPTNAYTQKVAIEPEPVVESKPVVEPKLVVAPKFDVAPKTVTPEAVINSKPVIESVKVAVPSEYSKNDDLSQQDKLGTTLKNGRPIWAQERFECLLFSVAGLQLAVPLVSLGGVYKIEKHFTPLIGRASWFMGLYRHENRNVRVIDTAKVVMPDRASRATEEGYHYIIRLGGNNWGMACDSVQEAIRLEPSEVKWRTERSKRAWLAGTVIKHMCALLDADTLSEILKVEAKSKRSALFA